MVRRIKMETNWSLKELKELVSDENSCIYFQRVRRHLGLHPFHLNDLNKGICEILSARINFFDPELNGLILACKNPKLVSSLGGILHDSHFVHIDVDASFYYFKPEIGTTLKGIITKVGENHLGAVVHKTFNVSLPGHDEDSENWLGNYLSVSDPVTFTVTRIEFKGGLPFIRGKIIPTEESNEYNDVDDEEMDTSVIDSKKKKTKKSVVTSPPLKSYDSFLESRIPIQNEKSESEDDENSENEVMTKKNLESPSKSIKHENVVTPKMKKSNKIFSKSLSPEKEDEEDEVIPSSQTMSQSRLKRKKKVLIDEILADQENNVKKSSTIDRFEKEEKIGVNRMKGHKEAKTKKKSNVQDSANEMIKSPDQYLEKTMKKEKIISKKDKKESSNSDSNEDDDEVIPNSQSSPTVSQSKLKKKKNSFLEASSPARNESQKNNMENDEKIENKIKALKETTIKRNFEVEDSEDETIESRDKSLEVSTGKKIMSLKKSKKESQGKSVSEIISDSDSSPTIKKSKLKSEETILEVSPKKRSRKNDLHAVSSILKQEKDDGEKENGVMNSNGINKTKGISIIHDHYPAGRIIELEKISSKKLKNESPVKSIQNSSDEEIRIKNEQINTKKKKNANRSINDENGQIQKYTPLNITKSGSTETVAIKLEPQSDVETFSQKKVQRKSLKKEDSGDSEISSPVKKEPIDRPKKAKKRKAEMDFKEEPCKSENDVLPKKKSKLKFTE